MLLELPAAPAPWKPKIEQQDVRWVDTRHYVRCRYWDSKRSKTKYKSIRVTFPSGMDDEDKEDKVRRVAVELQEFYDRRHNKGDDMPNFKRGRISRDEENDCGEPVQTDSRTEAA